jgi:uncharacterized iron-regulated protein
MHENGIIGRGLACAVIAAAGFMSAPPVMSASAGDCVPAGTWATPAGSAPEPVDATKLLPRLARKSVVLLGETHDNADHHRWQLQTLTALHALRPGMALAFEMFPRRVQPVLDRWVAGELGEAEFLAAAAWSRIWSIDAQLYLPIFHFARMNRVPMVAMNVDHELVKAVDEKGYDAVPPEQREGITRPAAPSDAYLEFLMRAYRAHDHVAGAKEADRDDPAFRRFVESQQLWDRAMAQGIAAAVKGASAPLVVGILGGGHVVNGFGVPHQLKDLGVTAVAWLMPWDQGEDCKRLTAGYADAVFGVGSRAKSTDDAASQRPRLGVLIDTSGEGVLIKQVEKGSIAEAAGIKDGDLISEAAGVPVKEFTDLRTIIQRQAPGTWLPLKIKRQNETLETVAKFPPAKQ